jgi:AraC-like ligand binding domain
VLAITESGSARINCWGQWFTAGSGDIFVSNPNDPQAAMTLGAPWKYRAFYLARYALDQLAHVLDLAAPGNYPARCFVQPFYSCISRIPSEQTTRLDVLGSRLLRRFAVIQRSETKTGRLSWYVPKRLPSRRIPLLFGCVIYGFLISVYLWLRSPFLPLAGRWDFFLGRAVLARWINVGTIV